MDKGLSKSIAEISDILGMSGTDRKILNLLVRTKKKFTVTEITSKIKRSERSVKERLKNLTKLKLVRREITTTKKSRLAYRYFALHVSDLVKLVREETLRRLRRLERYTKGAGRKWTRSL